MTEYKIHYTSDAFSDLDRIIDYISINLKAPQTAIRLGERIMDEIRTLSTFPERNTLFDTEPERSRGFRRLIVDNYSAIYFVEDSDVVIVRIFYNGADILSRLRGEL